MAVHVSLQLNQEVEKLSKICYHKGEKKMDKKDLFKAFLVENADFDGKFELSQLRTSDEIPDKVILFSDYKVRERY